jgi:hypothetical protein
MKAWNSQETELLRKLFPITATNELIPIFNRSKQSILLKSRKLGLRKTKLHRSIIAGKTNKLVNRDLSFDNVKSIASKFKTRGDFKEKDSSAYKTAIKHGWIDEICSHMLPQNYSTPQLILNIIIKEILMKETRYNDRKAIKPLELDVYVPELKIAFEYDGKFWHKEKNTKKLKMCIKNGIKLFILTETNRSYEKDVKNQLCLIIDDINKCCGTHITEKQIHSIKIDYENIVLDYADLKRICSENNNYKQFQIKFPSIWLKLKRSKLLKEYTSHMKRWTR